MFKKSNPASRADEALGRSRLHGLLARVFREEPTPDLLTLVGSSSFRDALGGWAVSLSESLAQYPQAVVVQELSVAFARLFLGPGHHVSPHESVQLAGKNGALWGKETVAVQCFIEQAGFELSARSTHLPDHISVELDFLSHLTRLESEAWREADFSAVGNTLDWQASFFSRHIGRWVAPFCNAILASHPPAFYGICSDMLSQFIASEHAAMDDRKSALRLFTVE